MGFVFDESPRKLFSTTSPKTVEELTRAVAFETPSVIAREILTDILNSSSRQEIAKNAQAFQALLVLNIERREEFTPYVRELVALHKGLSPDVAPTSTVITTTLANHITRRITLQFLANANGVVQEEARRVSFLALLDAMRSLNAITSLLVDKEEFVWIFTEAFMLVKSFVQATHIELIESAIGERQQKSASGKKYQPKAVCVQMVRALFQEAGAMPSGNLLRYMKKKYASGYDLAGVRFTVITDNQGRDTLAHAAIGEDGQASGKVILERSTVDNYISVARKSK